MCKLLLYALACSLLIPRQSYTGSLCVSCAYIPFGEFLYTCTSTAGTVFVQASAHQGLPLVQQPLPETWGPRCQDGSVHRDELPINHKSKVTEGRLSLIAATSGSLHNNKLIKHPSRHRSFNYSVFWHS